MDKRQNQTSSSIAKAAQWLGAHGLYPVICILVVSFVGTYLVLSSHADSTDSLYLTPASSNESLGSTFTVTLYEDSYSDSVNAVQANLTYSTSALQFESVDYTNSAFSIQAVSTGGSGSIQIARGTTSPVTGIQIVGVITFEAVGAGSTNVSFGCINGSGCSNGDALVSSTDNSNVLSAQTNGTYDVVDTTPPSVPTGLASSTTTVTTVGLTWTASTDNVGVTGYKVYRNGTQVGTSATTSYTDTGLTPNTSYTYTVAAYDAAGNLSAQSSGFSAKTAADTTPPTVPGTPSETSNSMTSVTLGWTASTDNVGVTGYKVYRNGTQVGTSATTSYTDSGLTPNTHYTYTIAAYDAAGNLSAQSTGTSLATAPDTQPPTSPTNLSGTSSSSTTVSLTWTASTDNVGVTGYDIYRNGTQVGTSATTSYTDTGLTANTSYSYQVAAYDAASNVSTKSSSISTTTDSTGDLNSDGVVNIFDLSILLSHWGQTGGSVTGDLNHDGVVNLFDLSILLSHYV